MTEQRSGAVKATRERSPNYPGIGLEDAIQRAAHLYRHTKRSWVPPDSALEVWGYKPKSGQGLVVLAALKKFGLLEDEGRADKRRVRISDAAFRIVEDDDSPERSALLQEAALKPAIHQELWDQFDGDLPGDIVLRRHLRFERGFTESAIREFIPELRRTLEFAGLIGNGDMLDDEGAQTPEGADMSPSATAVTPSPRAAERSTDARERGQHALLTPHQELAFRLSEDSWARTSFDGPVTQAGIKKLIALLELQMDTFPESVRDLRAVNVGVDSAQDQE